LWLPDYLRSRSRARREARGRTGLVDVMLAVVDHYEPRHRCVDEERAQRRVDAWHQGYPGLASRFVDSDGRHPQHTFFYPIEQYREDWLDQLTDLVTRGFGEVEIHLHHDADTAERLTRDLEGFVRLLRDRHGLLSTDPDGRVRYSFIHGNWALSNALPGGRWCGVDDELRVLDATGCYADFTNPSAPSPAQTRTVNQIYYARVSQPGPRAHEFGRRAAVGRAATADELLIVQGPLALNWRDAKYAVLPRLEAADLHAGLAPTADRFADWVTCGICVAGKPDWVFVKIHTHGAPERNAAMLLGDETAAFHAALRDSYNDGRRFRLHYVTAREMVNIVHAAEDGKSGNPNDFRDYRYRRSPV
jgi:hypothetical protein